MESIYAVRPLLEISSLAPIRIFCSHKSEQRLDAIIFAHKYAHIGSLYSRRALDLDLEKQRQTASESCATFLIMTLLLPLLLTAPTERDISLIMLVNPFYAAVVRTFSTSRSSGLPHACPPYVILSIPDRRPTCSAHIDIHDATSETRLRRPPFRRVGSLDRRSFPVHTRRKRQGPTFEHRGSVRVAGHQPHRRDRATASR